MFLKRRKEGSPWLSVARPHCWDLSSALKGLQAPLHCCALCSVHNNTGVVSHLSFSPVWWRQKQYGCGWDSHPLHKMPNKIINNIHLACRLLHCEHISTCTCTPHTHTHPHSIARAHTHTGRNRGKINVLSLAQNSSHNHATRQKTP